VAVGLLGPFEVRLDGTPVDVPGRRVRALLTALALRAGRVVSVDGLVEQVWDGDLPVRARSSLQTLANRLRTVVGAAALRTAPDGYALQVPADAVDVLRFDRYVRQARAAEPGTARSLLADALALWRGEPLAGCGSALLEREVAPALLERYLTAVELRIDLDLELGNHDGLAAEVRQLADRHPLREPLWLRLMAVLHRSGRAADALDAYHTIRARLADEVGADPSAELRQLYATVLAADGPPATPTQPVPRQLPAPIPGFVGRATELAALDAALADGARLLAVHGPGGIGKTALAVRWAHRVADRYPDGQLFLDLAGYGPGEPLDPSAALEVVLRALGVPATRIPAGRDERSALLRTELAGRRTLLVLDNARDADQVRPLLPSGASLVLATSRSELRGLQVRDGARTVALPALPVAEAVTLIHRAGGGTRTDDEPSAADELAGLCGRLPLALMIVARRAARFPGVPLAELAAQLREDSRLDALSDPTDPAADPRAVFSWSYRGLEPAAARAFRLLGLHPGTRFGARVAAALLGTPVGRARRLLDQLVSVHLLDQTGPDAYHLHDLLDAYAVELATEHPEPDHAAATRRMLDWYLQAAGAARTAVFGPSTLRLLPPGDAVPAPPEFTAASAAAWYDLHHGTLRALIELAAEHRYDTHCWQLANLLGVFQDLRHHREQRRRTAELAVLCAERSGGDEARLRSWYQMGSMLAASGDHAGAIDWRLRSLAVSERIGDEHMTATTMSAIGMAYAELRRFAEATDWGHRAVRAAEGTGSTLRRTQALLNLGYVEWCAGRYPAAERCYRAILDLGEQPATRYLRAMARSNLAELLTELGRYDEARRHADRALALAGDVEDGEVVGTALIARGTALSAAGDHTAARASWQRALRILDGTGRPDETRVRELLAEPPG